MLREGSARHRAEAAWTLGQQGDKKAVPHLVKVLKDPDASVRAAAADALGKLGGKEAAPALGELLKDEDPMVRALAALALGKLGDKAAVPALSRAVMDPASPWATGTPDGRSSSGSGDRDFGREMVETLAKLEPKAPGPLVAALRSPLAGARSAAAAHLQKRKWRPATDIDKAYYLVAKGELGEAAKLGVKAVEPIVAAVRPEGERIARQAADALVQMGSKAFDPALAILAHKDPTMRAAGVRVLAELGDQRAVDPLIAAGSDADLRVSAAVVHALRRIEWAPATATQKAWRFTSRTEFDKAAALGKPAIRPLSIAVVTFRDRTRLDAAKALAAIGGKEAVAVMVTAMKSKDASLRQTAAQLLGKLGGPEAVTALIASLADESERVRARVAEALGKVGDKKAVEPLASVLKKNDEAGDVLNAAAVALANLGDPRGAFRLVMFVEHGGWGSESAVAALNKLGKAAVPALIAALDQDDYYAAPVITYLGKLGDRRAVAPLMKLLPVGKKEGRCTGLVAEALGNIGDPRPAERLARLMTSEDFHPAGYVSVALAKIGPGGRKLLVGMLGHKERDVRADAAKALAKSTWKPANQDEKLAYLVSLGRYGEAAKAGAAAAPALLRAMTSWDDDRVRAALVGIGAPAVKPLLKFLDVEGTDLKGVAISVLGDLKDKRAAGPLRKLLSHKEYHIREGAEKALAKIGPADMSDVKAALKDKDPKKREAAVQMLRKLPGDNTDLLVAALKDKAWTVRYWAAIGLEDHPSPKAIPALVHALNKDEAERVREYAAKALAKIGAPAVEPLIKTLESGDRQARLEAAAALGGMRDKRAIPHLVKAMLDEDFTTASTAANALRRRRWTPANNEERATMLMAVGQHDEAFKLGKAALKPALVALGRDRRAGTRIISHLAKLGDKRAVPPLIGVLKDGNTSMMMAAIDALKALGDKRATVPIAALLMDHRGSVGKAAADALIALWDPKAFDAVAAAMKVDYYPRLRAIKVLKEVRDPRGLKPLVEALKGRNWQTREAAADALGALGDVRAIEALQAVTKDRSARVRQAVAIALKKLKAKKE